MKKILTGAGNEPETPTKEKKTKKQLNSNWKT